MRSIVTRLFFPTALLASLFTFAMVRAAGGDLELAVVIPSAATLVAAMLLERRMPFQPKWNRADGDSATDWLSMATLLAAVDPLLKWAGPALVAALYARLDLRGGLFPPDLPFVLQVAMAALIAEFGFYWAHRLHHSRPALWWLHALHHGSKRLYSVNNFRLHPLNYGLNYLFGILPLLLIGAPPDVLYGYLALTYPVLMLQHANLTSNGVLTMVRGTIPQELFGRENCGTSSDAMAGPSLISKAAGPLAAAMFMQAAPGPSTLVPLLFVHVDVTGVLSCRC